MNLLQRLHQYLSPPVLPGEAEKTRVASLLNIILWGIIANVLMFAILSPFIYPKSFSPIIMLGVMLLLRHGLIVMMRRGRVLLASLLVSTALWIIVTVLMLLSGGMNGPHMVTYVTTVLTAGLLLGGRGGVAFALFSTLAGLLIAYLNTQNALPETILSNNTPLTTWIVLATNLVIVGIFQYLALNSLNKALNRERSLAQTATEANEYKDRLIARVSHELRSPLGAILGLADMLHYGALGPMPTEQQDATKKIVINSYYLKRLVDELLEQSLIEGGQLIVQKKAFSPAEMFRQVSANLIGDAIEKGISLNSELSDDLPAEIIGDVNHCEQILFNLAFNAIKFTEKGSVTMRAFLPDKDTWALQVADTGVGLSLEVQSRVFEPFWQMNESAARKYGGMGLGLSIVKQLTTLMHGQITLESQEGHGSTFTVILPRHLSEGV